MKNYDIRKGDVVRFRPDLTEEEKQKIARFASRISKQSNMKNYALKTINSKSKFKIHRANYTEKKPTEYAVIVTEGPILMPVQSRFLVVEERKPKHPLTSMFSDFKKNG